jgi:hypothetical protein
MIILSKEASDNGNHIEELITGHKSNCNNHIDIPELKIEIKSCLEHHKKFTKKRNETTRSGSFKINLEQHQYLLSIDGFYLFAVQDISDGEIRYIKKVNAIKVESICKFTQRKIPKTHYFTLNWKRAFKITGIEGYDIAKWLQN